MGISERARNITDTSLKRVLVDADDPARALKDHLLRLESSLRELAQGREALVRQSQWLSTNIDRSLREARAEEDRAARLVALGMDAEARSVLIDRDSALASVASDKKRLAEIEASLPPLDVQISLLGARIDQAKALRAKLAAGQPLRGLDLSDPGSQS